MKKRISVLLSFMLFFSLASQVSASESGDGDKVTSIAMQYQGVPYKWGGTTPSGFDCSGFILYVFDQIGMDLPHGSADQFNIGTSVSKSNLQPGDLVFFKNTYKQGISHTGIYIGNDQFISAANSGVKVDSINDPYYWGAKYAGAKRVIKEEEKTPPPATLPTGQYHDVSAKYWAKDEIEYLSKKGIINGYQYSMFKPDSTVTRAEVAKMLSETFDLKSSKGTTFSDVSTSHWANEYITAATEKGLFVGYGSGKFNPDSPITRGEIAALFNRAFNLTSQETTGHFNDLPDSHWAYDDVQTLTASSIATGYSNNTFQPNKETKRSEFSVFLYRALTQ
ncbi:S-layer homology domain-containing protein [Rossellomorea sp. NPDC077527]|uniref:C40 family peptidase n=1 Tax=Rossellomorea sp. NPDC077527 TaxID=3364510 RepID=UPI0037C594E1